MAKNVFKNRRRAYRVDSIFPVQVQDGLGWSRCYARNVSAYGIQLIVDRPFEDDEQLSLVLHPSRDLQVEVLGKPIWHKPISGDRHLVGVSFLSGQRSRLTELEDWVRNQPAA